MGYSFRIFDLFANYILFSEVILQDFQWVDAPATSVAEAAALYEVATDTYASAGTLDISLSFQMIKGLKLTLGGNNLLNIYPTQQFDGWTDQGGFSDSVQMGSDGRYLFGRVGINF